MKRTDLVRRSRGTRRRIRRLLPLLLGLVSTSLLGCPFGFDVADNGGIGGTGSPAVSSGPITAFGSIFVNGIEWETDQALISVDDVPALETALRLGMVVRVEGTVSADGLRGVARKVRFDAAVEGPIDDAPEETVPGVEKRFSVLGRVVIVKLGFTIFDGSVGFDDLAAGDLVEVSGLLDPDGHIVATRVEGRGAFEPGLSEAELHGVISGWMPVVGQAPLLGTFVVDGILVEIYEDTELDGLALAGIADGLEVEIEGVLLAPDEIRAERLEREDDDGVGEEGARVELTGIVSAYLSDADFRVAGMRVDASNAEIEDDLVLGNGVLVEIDGRVAGGVIVAEEVEAGDRDDLAPVRIRAQVAAVDPKKRTLEILGLTVRAKGKTRLQDELLGLPNFSLDDVVPGDWLEIEGDEEGAGEVTARRIVRRAGDGDVELQGRVSFHDLQQQIIEILDLPLPPVASGALYLDAGGALITLPEFVALLLSGNEVVVRARDLAAVDGGAIGEIDELEFSFVLPDA